jgi:amino acid transporter
MNEKSELKKNSISLLGALALSAAFMGPAVSIFFNVVSAAGVAGNVFPLSFLISMIAIFFIANSMIQYSKKLAGSSFAFTYVSNGFGPRTGYFAGWLLLLAYAMISPITYAGFGVMAQAFLKREFGINISWILFFVIIACVVSTLSLLGVSTSTKTAILFLTLEITVILILCLSVIFGGAHNSISSFNISHANHGISSVGLGMVYGILSFVGFEAATNFGEEAKKAHSTIPKAIIISVLMVGTLYVIGAYTASIAFDGNAQKIAADSSPFDTIARLYWGSKLSWIISITALNSVFANAVAGQATIVRNLFALGKVRILPHAIGKTNKKGTPINAIILDFFLALILGLTVGAFTGGWGVWNILGGIMSLALIIVYGLVTASLPKFYYTNYKNEFSKWKHLVCPTIGVLLLLLPLYSSLWPIPSFPYNLTPYIIILWCILGFVYLKYMVKKDPEIVDKFGKSLD